MQCGLCQQDAGNGATHQVAGLKVCAGCFDAPYLPDRLHGRGFHLGYMYKTPFGAVEPGSEDQSDNSLHTLSALAEAPKDSGMHTKLEGEGLRAKFMKIFEHELQVGNKAFDDKVWIHTNTLDITRGFLSLSGVQTAVAEIIDMGGEIDIDGAKVYCKTSNKGPIEVRMFLLFTAALLHYLSEFT
jgi:hypothetical protein